MFSMKHVTDQGLIHESFTTDHKRVSENVNETFLVFPFEPSWTSCMGAQNFCPWTSSTIDTLFNINISRFRLENPVTRKT